jgi:hypothetical protein
MRSVDSWISFRVRVRRASGSCCRRRRGLAAIAMVRLFVRRAVELWLIAGWMDGKPSMVRVGKRVAYVQPKTKMDSKLMPGITTECRSRSDPIPLR